MLVGACGPFVAVQQCCKTPIAKNTLQFPGCAWEMDYRVDELSAASTQQPGEPDNLNAPDGLITLMGTPAPWRGPPIADRSSRIPAVAHLAACSGKLLHTAGCFYLSPKAKVSALDDGRGSVDGELSI